MQNMQSPEIDGNAVVTFRFAEEVLTGFLWKRAHENRQKTHRELKRSFVYFPALSPKTQRSAERTGKSQSVRGAARLVADHSLVIGLRRLRSIRFRSRRYGPRRPPCRGPEATSLRWRTQPDLSERG